VSVAPAKHTEHVTNASVAQRRAPPLDDAVERHLEEAKKAKARRAAKAAAQKQRPVRFIIEMPAEMKEMAERACMIEKGVLLSVYVRSIIKALRDRAPQEAKRTIFTGRPRTTTFLPQDREWGEMITEYLADPAVRETSVGELLDSLDVPEESRVRSDQIAIGRIMRVLGWYRLRVSRGGKMLWVYRRPAR